MPKYTVCVEFSLVEEFTVDADDDLAAQRAAIEEARAWMAAASPMHPDAFEADAYSPELVEEPIVELAQKFLAEQEATRKGNNNEGTTNEQ